MKNNVNTRILGQDLGFCARFLKKIQELEEEGGGSVEQLADTVTGNLISQVENVLSGCLTQGHNFTLTLAL